MREPLNHRTSWFFKLSKNSTKTETKHTTYLGGWSWKFFPEFHTNSKNKNKTLVVLKFSREQNQTFRFGNNNPASVSFRYEAFCTLRRWQWCNRMQHSLRDFPHRERETNTQSILLLNLLERDLHSVCYTAGTSTGAGNSRTACVWSDSLWWWRFRVAVKWLS